MLIVSARPDPERQAALEERGAEVISLPTPNGQVDLHALISELGRRQLNEIHVEAGARLNAALLQADLVDELLVYQAPMLMGPGRGMATLPALQSLAEAQRFEFYRVDRVGDDLRLMLRKATQAPNV